MQTSVQQNSMEKSKKKYVTTVCLSGVFGLLGIHHFYLGRWLHGAADLSMSVSGLVLLVMGFDVLGCLVLGIDIIHTVIVTIFLLIGKYKDGYGYVVSYPGQTLKK